MSVPNANGATHFKTVSTDTDIIIVWSQEQNNETDGIYLGVLPKMFNPDIHPGMIFESPKRIIPRSAYSGEFQGGGSVENLFLYYDPFTKKPVISFVAGGAGSPQKSLVTGWLNGDVFQLCPNEGGIKPLTNSQEIYDFSIEFELEPNGADPKFVTTYGVFDNLGQNFAVFADRHG